MSSLLQMLKYICLHVKRKYITLLEGNLDVNIHNFELDNFLNMTPTPQAIKEKVDKVYLSKKLWASQRQC